MYHESHFGYATTLVLPTYIALCKYMDSMDEFDMEIVETGGDVHVQSVNIPYVSPSVKAGFVLQQCCGMAPKERLTNNA